MCTCYKGHKDQLDAITTSIANCAAHGPEATRPREMRIVNIAPWNGRRA